MPTTKPKTPPPKFRQAFGQTMTQGVETIDVARSGARQVGNLFDRIFCPARPLPPVESPTLSSALNRKQARAHFGEFISDMCGWVVCALVRRGR